MNGHSSNGVGDVLGADFGYFSAGPSKLPTEVMERAQRDFLCYESSRVSVMELSHRSPEYLAINDQAIACVRRLFNVPNNYKVMFMAGGGTGQFAAVPFNLMKEGKGADYCVTGTWSEKAWKEGKKYGDARNVLSLANFNTVPQESGWEGARRPDASYLYYCDNETVHGVEFPFIPSSEGRFADVPVVADMSSNLGTRLFDVSRFGAVYATVQKNLGPAGCTIVVAREDLLGKAHQMCPSILDYSQVAKGNSVMNTPVTFSVYMTKLVMEWVEENGGVAQMEKQSRQKSALLYDLMDSSNGFYSPMVHDTACRSRCNVVFRLKDGDEQLEAAFLSAAKQHNLLALKGHRSVGGIRASLYNAIPLPMVERLAAFMREFQANHS